MKENRAETTAPDDATDVRCFCCGRRGWHRATFDGFTVKPLLCCLGPGDPWLTGQNEEDRATFVNRAIGAFQAADRASRQHAEGPTGEDGQRHAG